MTPDKFPCMLRMLCLSAAFLVVCAAAAHAQRFQWTAGGPVCSEAGRGGVTQLANGGYVSVGESYSLVPGCIDAHIYVVVTDAGGNLVWSQVYQIGTSDSALDVVECCNGDLAICGVTTNAANCNPGRDAFVLRLAPTGGVIAARTFGTLCSDEIAWNIIEAETGNGGTTNPGDLIVAGSTTFNAGIIPVPPSSGGRDGYIFRVDAGLNLIWDQHYGGPNSFDDYLYGVSECRVGVMAGITGDIVATGSTSTPFPGNYDTWVLRVNGDNGTIGAAPQNSASYGGPGMDEGRAIVELQYSANPGDLAIAGISFSAPATNSEIDLIRTAANPCVFMMRRWAGDNGPQADGGMDLKEDEFRITPNGNLIVTGYTGFGPAAFAPPNAFLARFDANVLLPVGPTVAYGGIGADWGWSVNNCRRDAFCTNESEGYVMSGFTQSPGLIPAGDVRQMYVVKTDVNLNSLCNQLFFGLISITAPPAMSCNPMPYLPIGMTCVPTVIPVGISGFAQLCYMYP